MTVHGHVARTSTLLSSGISASEIRRALCDGLLRRPRLGWYATHQADADQLAAATVGLRIGCVSALRRWGAWGGESRNLHLHALPTDSRIDLGPIAGPTILPGAARPDWLSLGGRPALHVSRQRFPNGRSDWIVSRRDALLQAILCVGVEHAVACLDSSLHERVLTRAEREDVLRALPFGLQRLEHSLDPGAHSGNESIVAYRLRADGHEVRTQVHLENVGRVDMLVDDLVIVEVDGDRFHSSRNQRRVDRTRTLVSQSYGMPVVRIGSEHLRDDDWPLALAAVRQQLLVARASHRLRVGIGIGIG